MKVRVVDAPGYCNFTATVNTRVPAVDDRGDLLVLLDDEKELYIIPSKYCHKQTERICTLWVCQSCMLHHANGECGDCYDGHDKEPWSRLADGERVSMGMMWDEHDEDCENRTEGEYRVECDCDHITYSLSRCKGCGSYLHGERYAMTLWG